MNTDLQVFVKEALTQDLNRIGKQAKELKEIRNNYQRLCRNNGLLDPSTGRLSPEVQNQIDDLDRKIEDIETGITRIANVKKIP